MSLCCMGCCEIWEDDDNIFNRYVAAHLIGRRAIYPGSLAVFNMLLSMLHSSI